MKLRRLSRAAYRGMAALGLVVAACKGSPDSPPDPVGPAAPSLDLVVASGRVERSLTISLGLRRNGTESGVAGATLSASPATAVRFEGDSSVTLLEAGRVLLIAAEGGAIDTLALDVAVPPTIVFDRTDGGTTHHIFSVTLDGRALTRLTSGVNDDQYPTVGGASVIYASFDATQSDLRRTALTGGSSSAVTNTPDAFETEPSLSRDGAQLAYARSGIASGVPKLWIASGDGSNARAAAPTFGDVGSVDAAPSWTPDGGRLAFVSTAPGTSQLYVYDRQSGAVSPLGVGAGPNVSPAWNADGRTLAFSSARNGAPGLYQTDAATTGAVWLVRGSEGEPAWTKDGRVVYASFAGGVSRIRWIDPSNPSIVHEVDTGTGSAAHPAIVP